MNDRLAQVARAAIAVHGIESAAIFILEADADQLALGAAAGIDDLPLERLAAAVRNPDHPIARTLTEESASFDVTPMAPGGPRLRGHVPILSSASAGGTAVGVLAVAYDDPLDPPTKDALVALATEAARAIET